MRYKSKDNLYKLSFDLSYHGLNLLPVKGMSAESVSDDLAAWWDLCAGYVPHPPGFFR